MTIHKVFPYLVMFVVVTLWSSAGVVGSQLGSHMNAIDISVWRTILGMLTLGLFIRPYTGQEAGTKKQALKLQNYAPLWIVGVVGYGAMQVFFFLSAQHTQASHLILIMALTPLTLKLARFMLRKEALEKMDIMGSLLAVAGAMIILSPKAGEADMLYGDLLAFCAMISFSIYSEGVNVYGSKMSPSVANFHVFGAALVILLLGMIVLYLQGGIKYSFHHIVQHEALWSLLYLGICTTGLAYMGYSWAIRRLSVTTAASFLYLQPILGMLLSWLLLDESLTLRFLSGTILILVGLMLLQRSEDMN